MKTIAAAFLISLFVIPLLAHHSVTKEFDQTKATNIQGIIKKVEWINPHSSIIFAAKDANGCTQSGEWKSQRPALCLKTGFGAKIWNLQNRVQWKSGPRVMDRKSHTAAG